MGLHQFIHLRPCPRENHVTLLEFSRSNLKKVSTLMLHDYCVVTFMFYLSAGQSRSLLPVPVRSVESGVRSSKVQAKSTGTTFRKEKSRIPVLSNQFTIHAPKIEALKKREREIMAEFFKVRAEREHVESLQRKLLVHKPTPVKTRKRRSKSLALDSPFSLDNDSHNMGNMSPLPLLSPTQSKNPGSIYENYRRTLNFLQTPSRSTFKHRTRSTLQSDNGTNVSQLVQSQLAHLFN